MSARIEAYRQTDQKIPKDHLVWELHDSGMQHLGREGAPALLPVPRPDADEILARVDALGLCFSDVKIIQLGGDHPRLGSRDLAKEPIVVGHEVSVTVVEVGENLRDRYAPGERLVVQPDAFQHGQNISYGYHLRGGAAQYTILGEALHSGDAGSYLAKVQGETGYSEAALAEPWACVERAYRLRSRPGPKPQGLVWIVGLVGGDLYNYSLGEDFDYRGGPRRVLMTEVIGPVATAVKRHADRIGFHVEETAPLAHYLRLLEERNKLYFDDIILLGKPRKGQLERFGARLAKGGHLAIVSPETLEHRADIDLGRIHYDFLHHIGTATWVAMEAYHNRRSSAITEAGSAWLVGAGGPMGQMHLERLIEREHTPRLILVTDTDEARLDLLKERFQARAVKGGSRFVLLHANEISKKMVQQITDGEGFSHIVLLAPRPEAVAEAWPYLGEKGILNVFAGLARGTKANLRPSPICNKGCRIVGSTGSNMEDLRYVLGEAQAGRLHPDRVVAAVGGIEALRQGLEAVAAGTYPGKVVIYPQLNCGLLPVAEMPAHYPEVAEKLEEGRYWNREAEAALFERLLPDR